MTTLTEFKKEWSKAQKTIADTIDEVDAKERAALTAQDRNKADKLRGYKKMLRRTLWDLNDSMARKVLTTANANAIVNQLDASKNGLNDALSNLKTAGDTLDAAAKALGAVAALVGVLAAL